MKDIRTAPKDGTDIILFNAKWDILPIGKWGSYPGNPVCDGSGKEFHMAGWILKDEWASFGEEEGFLGWETDHMPTHWMPLPKAEDFA